MDLLRYDELLFIDVHEQFSCHMHDLQYDEVCQMYMSISGKYLEDDLWRIFGYKFLASLEVYLAKS